ncbi:MAG TPA: hypothetical protein VFV78_01190 [Vicinamibacterales bacterium]|nr:hypothetical protein [Vicinamibacterales bacterium]
MSTLVYLALAIVIGRIVGAAGGARPPFAVPAYMLAAVIGAVSLSLPLGDQGPHLGTVAVVPAVAGAVAGALLLRVTLAHLVSREG